MKNTLLISAAAMLFYATSQICGCGCKTNAQTPATAEVTKGEPKTVTLKVTGMTCGSCANHIHSALSKKDGILEDEVKYPGDVAIVKYDPDKITEKEIIETIITTGYKAELMKDEKKDDMKKKEKSKPGKVCAPGC